MSKMHNFRNKAISGGPQVWSPNVVPKCGPKMWSPKCGLQVWSPKLVPQIVFPNVDPPKIWSLSVIPKCEPINLVPQI